MSRKEAFAETVSQLIEYLCFLVVVCFTPWSLALENLVFWGGGVGHCSFLFIVAIVSIVIIVFIVTIVSIVTKLILFDYGSDDKPQVLADGGQCAVVAAHEAEAFDERGAVVAGGHTFLQVVDDGEG